MDSMSPTTLDNIKDFPKEQDYLIAYIDILGAKNLLKSDDNLFSDIYTAFFTAVFLSVGVEFFTEHNVKVKIFTDNILIGYPIQDITNKEHVFQLYRSLIFFLKAPLMLLLNKHILFRGAMTINKLAINDMMVWGQGVLEAVDLEENVAVYPRIILSEKLVDILQSFEFNQKQFENAFEALEDFDGCYYFDYFNYSDIQYLDNSLDDLENYISQQKSNCTDSKITQKLNWFTKYISHARRKALARKQLFQNTLEKDEKDEGI